MGSSARKLLTKKLLIGFLFGLLGSSVVASETSSYAAVVRQWRQQREVQLRSDTGWLTISGLFWLKEGSQTIGSDPSDKIQLPAHSAPARLGIIEFHSGKTTLHYADPAKGSVELSPDSRGAPTRIHLGSLTFWVIQRGDRYGIRLRDRDSKLRKEFTGCKWYPVKPACRVTARFVPMRETIRVPSIIGVTTEEISPGYLEFQLDGKTLHLRPSGSVQSLELMFRDGTSGKTTYGGGRFLPVGPVRNGKVVLDFNMAYNPPCAFTPYATCPVPIRENRLKVPIPAGEMVSTQPGH